MGIAWERYILESCYDKTTHEITDTGTVIKSVDISGTENYNEVW